LPAWGSTFDFRPVCGLRQRELGLTERITLAPVEMTQDVMQDLEHRGLIIRLCPDHHVLPARPGESLAESIYESGASHGPHELITVTVNRSTLAAFGTHPDNEEFLLIGDPETKPLYLVVALHRKTELQRRIAERLLTASDFVCLRVKYNDAQVSFFTMLAEVAHGEAVGAGEGRPASFYVTEPRDLETEVTEFGDYELCLTG
jgi:hypothetical protein